MLISIGSIVDLDGFFVMIAAVLATEFSYLARINFFLIFTHHHN